MLGYVEGFLEKRNNRYRISNICVFDNASHRQGIGTVLMNTILKEAGLPAGAEGILINEPYTNPVVELLRSGVFD